MTKIKICGLRTREDILAVNQAKPDYCGFIIEVPKSRRSVNRDQVKELTAGLCREVIPVGVFVNAPANLPVQLLKEGVIAVAQLHGQEDEAYIAGIRERTGKPVIKAFSVRSAADIERALVSSADYILLDQGDGGTGKCFDWSFIPEIERPFFLAGGLGKDNLEQAVRSVHPWAVDLSSSLEINGKKDGDRIQEAVSIVRRIS